MADRCERARATFQPSISTIIDSMSATIDFVQTCRAPRPPSLPPHHPHRRHPPLSLLSPAPPTRTCTTTTPTTPANQFPKSKIHIRSVRRESRRANSMPSRFRFLSHPARIPKTPSPQKRSAMPPALCSATATAARVGATMAHGAMPIIAVTMRVFTVAVPRIIHGTRRGGTCVFLTK